MIAPTAAERQAMWKAKYGDRITQLRRARQNVAAFGAALGLIFGVHQPVFKRALVLALAFSGFDQCTKDRRACRCTALRRSVPPSRQAEGA